MDDVLAEREETHGTFFVTAAVSQDLKDALLGTGVDLLPVQAEALDMICSKLARIVSGNPNCIDHWVDMAGYATLVADYLKSLHNKESANNVYADLCDNYGNCGVLGIS